MFSISGLTLNCSVMLKFHIRSWPNSRSYMRKRRERHEGEKADTGPACIYVDEATGTTLVEDGSYQQIEQTPVSIFGMLQAIPDGLIDAASIVSMVLVYGGAFGIINTTRVIEYGIASSIEKMRRFSALIIPVIMILFSLMGSMLGVSESCYAFIPLCIMLAKAMGYDAIVGFAMVMLANMMGFTAGPMNMYTTGIAQQIAELPLFSGIGVRLLVYVVLMALAIGYVLWYGARIKKDPTRSLMYNVAVAEEESIESKYSAAGFTARKKLTMAVLLLGFCGLIFGIVGLGWWEGSTIGGYLLGMSIVVAAVDGKKPNEMAQGFTDGAKGVLMGALMVGFARAIILILTEGNVIDTVLYYASLLINKTSSSVAAAVIYVFTFFFNFLVPSGSGKAAIVMPLLVPMADMADITRQTAVLAYQLGDGPTNLFWPTAAMAALAMGNVPYSKWFKWYLPLTLVIFVVSIIIVVICAQVGYGPF